MSMLVFWVVMPCELLRGYQRFGGTYCLHLQVIIIIIWIYRPWPPLMGFHNNNLFTGLDC
jgi:hypothetical protein